MAMAFNETIILLYSRSVIVYSDNYGDGHEYDLSLIRNYCTIKHSKIILGHTNLIAGENS